MSRVYYVWSTEIKITHFKQLKCRIFFFLKGRILFLKLHFYPFLFNYILQNTRTYI